MRRLGGAKPPLVYFMTIDKAKFRKPVIPGDRVEFHMTKLDQRRNIWWYQGEAQGRWRARLPRPKSAP